MIKQIIISCTEYSIMADWHEGNGTPGVLLTFVGFGSSKKSNSDFVARVVADTGLSALVVDLSGHGESPFNVNVTTPAQHIQEAVAAYDWILSNYPDVSIHVMGTSYGGFVSAFLSKYRAVEKLILRTPAIYEPSSLFTQHQFIDKIQVREYRKNVSEVERHPLFVQDGVADSKTLLIVHGEDKSVPQETTDVYRDKFDAELYIAEGFAHPFRDPSNPQEGVEPYYAQIASWLSR